MGDRFSNKKKLAIAGIAALAVIAFLLGIFINSVEKNRHESIVLPDASIETPPQEAPAAPEESFVQITTENVQDVLRTLSRPAYYHQTLSLTTYAGEASREQTAEIWTGGSLTLVQLTDNLETKSFLTDSETLYVWYGDSEDAAAYSLASGVQLEELTGVPGFETLLSAPASSLQEADLVSLSEQDFLQCVFVQCTLDSVTQYFWVDLDSGLLYRYMALADGQPFYTVQQTQFEPLMEADQALDGIFRLPDGTQPFS